jgi:hypothetical protein
MMFFVGFAGLTIDHAPVDGSIVVEFANRLYSVPDIETPSRPTKPIILPIELPPLLFAPFPTDPLSRAVCIARLGSLIPRQILDHAHKFPLVPFIIHVAIQAALQSDSSVPTPLVIRSVTMRRYAGGRSDPSHLRTAASAALVDRILDPEFDPLDPQNAILFKGAFASHETVTKAAKAGAGVGGIFRS